MDEGKATEKGSGAKEQQRFPILRMISLLLRIIGVVLCLAGIIFYGLYPYIIHGSLENILVQGSMVIRSLITGILFYAFGEVIQVFLAIEENTRKP